MGSEVALFNRRRDLDPGSVVERTFLALLPQHLTPNHAAAVTITESAGGVGEYERAVLPGLEAAVPAEQVSVRSLSSDRYELEDGTKGRPTAYVAGMLSLSAAAPDEVSYTSEFKLFVDEDAGVIGRAAFGLARAWKLAEGGRSRVPIETHWVEGRVVITVDAVPIAVAARLGFSVAPLLP